jgi:citrate synthase
LEGVVALESEIAEPDKEGSALRYRGVDTEEIVGRVPFEKVWGLLIGGEYEPGLPPAEPYNLPIHTSDVRADVQAGVAMLAPMLGMKQDHRKNARVRVVHGHHNDHGLVLPRLAERPDRRKLETALGDVHLGCSARRSTSAGPRTHP